MEKTELTSPQFVVRVEGNRFRRARLMDFKESSISVHPTLQWVGFVDASETLFPLELTGVAYLGEFKHGIYVADQILATAEAYAQKQRVPFFGVEVTKSIPDLEERGSPIKTKANWQTITSLIAIERDFKGDKESYLQQGHFEERTFVYYPTINLYIPRE